MKNRKNRPSFFSKMTPQDFNTLPFAFKAEALWTKGKLINERRIPDQYVVVIYGVYNFFVEVFYDLYSNKIMDIFAMENDDDWDGFLNSVNLEELF